MMYKICYNCEKREIKKIDGKLVTCHTYCEKYKKWKQEVADKQQEEYNKKRLNKDSYSKYWIESKERYKNRQKYKA